MKIFNSQICYNSYLISEYNMIKAFIILIGMVLACSTLEIEIANPMCEACHAIVNKIQKSVPQAPFIDVYQQIADIYCEQKKLQNKNVCAGAIKQMTRYIINSVWRHYTDPHLVCSQLLVCGKQYKKRNATQQILNILKDNPHKEWQAPTKRKIVKIMHISDLHTDLFYTEGAQTKCSEPVCCRSNVTKQVYSDRLSKLMKGQNLDLVEQTENMPKLNGEPAGYWGSLAHCDLPFQTFDLFLSELRKMEIDLILWTGDNTPHDVWQQTQSYNLNFTILQAERIKKSTNTRVIPAMGNHQSAPVNVYDYQGERQQVLNGGLAQAWKSWLDQQAYEMLRTKGYFSITIPKLNNLKIISTNTQAGNDLNWFLLRNPTDPGDMLKWIEDQLKKSQKQNQFVYLIGHIPPSDMLYDWSIRYNALVQRYSYVIRGQFYGHSHRDHMAFFSSMADKTKLTGYYLLAPSLTTYSDKNPNYRVMTIDYDTLQVLDYDQYMLDLRKYKKKEDNAKFQILYSFKSAYKVDDMTLNGGIKKVYQKMENDPQTQKLYTYLMQGGLNQGHAGRGVFCETLATPQLSAQCQGTTYKASSFQKAAGPWKTLNHKIQ